MAYLLDGDVLVTKVYTEPDSPFVFWRSDWFLLKNLILKSTCESTGFTKERFNMFIPDEFLEVV